MFNVSWMWGTDITCHAIQQLVTVVQNRMVLQVSSWSVCGMNHDCDACFGAYADIDILTISASGVCFLLQYILNRILATPWSSKCWYCTSAFLDFRSPRNANASCAIDPSGPPFGSTCQSSAVMWSLVSDLLKVSSCNDVGQHNNHMTRRTWHWFSAQQ